MGELADVLGRPKFRRYLSLEEAGEFVSALRLLGRRVDDIDLTMRATTCRDPDDEYLVALAQEHEALYLVSGDKDVLAVEQPGLLVRSPRAAVESLHRRHAWGPAIIPTGNADEGWRQAAAEGHSEVLAATSAFLQVLADPAAVDVLDRLVTPESLAAWTAALGGAGRSSPTAGWRRGRNAHRPAVPTYVSRRIRGRRSERPARCSSRRGR